MTFPSRKILTRFQQIEKEKASRDQSISSATGQGLSFDEIRSVDTSLNNKDINTISQFVDKGERDLMEFNASEARKEMEKHAKQQAIEEDKLYSTYAQQTSPEEAMSLMDDNLKIKNLEEKSWVTAYSRNAKFYDDSKPWYESINVAAPIIKAAGFLSETANDLFSDKKIGLSKKETQELAKLKEQTRVKLQPTLDILKNEFKQKQKEKQDLKTKMYADQAKAYSKMSPAQQAAERDKQDDEDFLSGWGLGDRQEDDMLTNTISGYEALLTQLEDYQSGKAGFWDGLGTQKFNLLTMGIYDLSRNATTASVKDKADRIEKDKVANIKNPSYIPKEKLTPGEVSVLELEGYTQELESKNLFEGKLGYSWGAGVGQSLVMLEQTAATGGFGGLVEKTVAEGILSGTMNTTLREAWQQGGTKLMLSTLGAKSAGGIANVAVTSAISPGAASMAAKHHIGNVEFVTDEKGKKKLLVGEERYNYYKKDFDKRADLVEYEIENLEKKQKRSEAEEQKLQGLKDGLQNLKEEFDTLYKPESWAESGWYGFSENVKENFSEKYIGDALPGVANNMLTRRIAKTELGGKIVKGATELREKFSQSTAGKVITAPLKGYNAARNVVNNLALGKLSNEAIAHTGQASLISSLPGEIAEEVWNQFMPTYKQEYAEQLEELQNASFYRDVVAQTLIMGGGFAGVGMAMRGRNYLNDKARLKELYKNLDASLTDDDVAKSILMNTGGTLYSPLDYDHKIMQLRKQNTAESNIQANKMEQNKFTNLAAMAIRTGTVDNFKKSLEGILNKKDVSDQTKQNIALAQGRIDSLMEVYDKHSEKSNFGTIFNLSERKLANEQTVGLINENLSKQKEGAKEEVDAFLLRNNMSIDYDIDHLLDADYNDQGNNPEYVSFIEALNKENLTRVQTYGALLVEKAGFQMDNVNLLKEINDQTSPLYEERVKIKQGINQVYEKTLEKYEKSILTSDKAVFNYNNELQESPELAEEAMAKVKEQYKGRVDAEFFDEVLQKRKDVLEIKELRKQQQLQQDNLKKLLASREAKTQPFNPETGEENIPSIIPPGTTVTVIDDIAESEHQNFVDGSLNALTDIFPVDANTPTVKAPTRKFINSTQEKLVQLRDQNKKDFDETSQNSDLTDEQKNERYQYLREQWDRDIEKLRKDNPDFGIADAQTYLEDNQEGVRINEKNLQEAEAYLNTFGKVKRTLQKSSYREAQSDVDFYKKRLEKAKEEEAKAQKEVNDIETSRRIAEGKYEDFLNLNSQGVEERKNQAIDDIRLIYGPYGNYYAPTSSDANGKNNYPEQTIRFNKGESLESKTKEEAIAKVTAFYDKRIAELENPNATVAPNATVTPDAIIIDDEEFDSSLTNYTPEQSAAAKAFTQDAIERIEARLGRKPTFRELIEQTYKYASNKEAIKSLFPHMIKGWEDNGYAKENYWDVYNDLFNPFEKAVTEYLKGMQNIFEIEMPVEEKDIYSEFEEEQEQVEKQVVAKTTSVVTYDEENMAVVTVAQTEQEIRNNLAITPKMGYTALGSITSVDEAGNITKRPAGTELTYQEGDLVDSRDLLDPNKFPTGTKVSVEIGDESLWSRVIATNGRNEKGELQFTTFDKWVKERQDKDPNFRNTQEFRDKVPMFYVDKTGKRIAYVQEVDKFDAYSVPNPKGSSKNPQKASQDLAWTTQIQRARDNARALRNNINAGLREVSITKSEDGPFNKLPLSMPKISVKEANPQAVLVVQRGTDLHIGFSKKFPGKVIDRQLFNAGEGGTNGNTWAMCQIGTIRNDKGELVPQYRAYPLLREVPDVQVETARWALAAHMTLTGMTDKIKGTEFEMTKEDAERIQTQINKQMGFNIESHLETVSFIKTFFQTYSQGDKISSYVDTLFNKEEAPNLRQHTNLKLLDTSYKVVEIHNGKVVPTDKTYKEYLMENLTTNIKSLNVGTEEKPVYATNIHPTITIDYVPLVENPGTEQIQEKQAETTQLAETIKQETTLDIAQHEKFLEGLNISLDDFEVSDDMIAGTDKLANLFKTTGSLNILQEKAIRQFIVHSIGEKVSMEYKSNVLKAVLKDAVKKELGDVLVNLNSQIKDLLAQVNNTSSTDPKVALLKEAYTTTLQNIKDINSNFTDLFDKSFADIQKQTQLVEKEKEVENENDSEETLSVKDYNKESIEESGKSKASYRLRRFLHKINKYDTKGVAQTTYLGLPSYMTFNDVYNELSKVLSMGSELESDYGKLIEKLKQSEAPFVKEIVLRLEGRKADPEKGITEIKPADQQIKNEFVYNFVRHTLSSKFGMYESVNGETTLKMYNTNANEANRIVTNKWKNDNMVSGLYNKNGTVNVAFAEKLLAEFESWDKDYTKVDQKDLRDWLGKLGITFQDAAWNQIYEKGIYNSQRETPFKDLYTVEGGGLFLPIVKFLTQAKNNPEKMKFDINSNIFSDLGGVTKALTLVETKYNPNLIALSFRDTGKNISTLVPTKYITDMVENLKRAVGDDSNTLIQDLKALSFSEDSVILDLLENVPAFKSLFKVHHVGLTSIKEKGENPNKAGITDLSDIDFDMNALAGFQDRKVDKLPPGTKIEGINMRMAHMLSPTMSDKSTGLYIETAVFDFMKDKSLLFNVEEDGSVTGFKIALKELLFEKLVLPELKRIVKFHRTVGGTNIKNYDNGAQLFHLLPVMNTLKAEDGTRILEKLADPVLNYTIEEAIEEFGPIFQNAIEDVVNQEVAHKKQSWAPYTETVNGKTTSKLFDKTYFTDGDVKRDPSVDHDLAITDFVLNNMLFNAEMFKVFAGDVANYSQDKVYTEERENKETGKKENQRVAPWEIKSDEAYISINKQIGTNLGKRLALLIAPGNKVANSRNESYNQIFLEDSVDITENASYLIKNYYGEEALTKATPTLDKYNEAARLLDRHQQGAITLAPEVYTEVVNTMKEARGKLSKDFADLSAYFDIESTDAQEYSTAAEHISLLHRMGRLTDKEKATISAKLDKGEILTKEELNVVFQPIKPVHTGTYINKDMDVNRVVYIKSSAFPLLPQLTAGTKLEGLRNKMEELEKSTGRFTRASFQTANKVGATKKTINPFDVNSLLDIREYSDTDVNSSVLTLKRDNFRIQQDVPFKSDKAQDDKVSMGTQFFKLLFGDGVIEEYKKEDRDKYATFPLDGKMVTGKELYQHYNKAFKDIVDSKKKTLFNELGLDNNGNVVDQNQFMVKLQDLLIKEATSRGYSLKSLAGLKIEQLQAKAGIYYEFKTPLWLSSDSNRYESLLNAIITNRIMKHKMPGNSFVAGSESGFRFKEGLEGIEQSRIIFFDNWNGKELQGTHTTEVNGKTVLNKAQVFVPSKFKGPDKKLIDLFEGFNGKEGKYIIRRENGTLGLKPGMIDPALFNSFTFRTPTSSHVSGSSVEIAGILPPESGDLMIVPKNFTKQKGLDYDIDKESAYQLNHIVDVDGKIKPLTKEYAEAKIQELKDKIEKANFNNLTASAKSNFAQELFKSFVQGTGSLLDEESLETLLLPQISLVEKLTKVEAELTRKVAENEFIKCHLAVFNNPDFGVQSKINKVLSIKFAGEQADLIEELTAAGEKNQAIEKIKAENPGMSSTEANKRYAKTVLNFTMLTNTYQKSKMNLGSIGKTAIGVYANYTTFNGLLQQNISGKEVYIMDENGDPRTITIGSFVSNGTLGVGKTLSPTSNTNTWAAKHQRTTAEVFAEKENTATDNEKEQILGRVGVNEDTINVDAYLSLLGFDKDELGNSISYMLLSQPAIKELVSIRKTSKGILKDFTKKEELLRNLIEKVSEGSVTYKEVKPGKFEFVSKETGQIVVPEGSLLTGQNLMEGIKYGGSDPKVQAHALISYIQLEKEARTLSTLQKTINANNLGKSMIESQLKLEALKSLPDNGVVKNVESLIGEFTTEAGTDGFWMGKYYVTPTTPQGQIVINGLQLGNTLYKDFFPYQEKAIVEVVKEILAIQGKEEVSDNIIIENFEDIVESIKKYIYSRQGNNVFEMDPRFKRFELFKDTETNTSLSTYLKSLADSKDAAFGKGLRVVSQNALLRSFTYESALSEEDYSVIKYNNAATDNLDEEELYNSIPELILMDKPLPPKNGQPYSTKQLAEDLVAYSFLQGGVQKATEFVKYVPVEYLETVGAYETVKSFENGELVEKNVFVPANRKLQGFNSKKNSSIDIFGVALGVESSQVGKGPSMFTRQYFQHNPSKAPKMSSKGKKSEENGLLSYVSETGKSPAFISVKNKKGEGQRYSLYENVGNGVYQKIDTLGNKGVNEYEYRNANVISINSTTIPTTPKVENKVETADSGLPFNILEGKTTIKEVATAISEALLSPEYAHLANAAKWLLPVIKNGGQKVILDKNLPAAGRAGRESLAITLNPKYTTETSADTTALVFIHELIHTVSAKEVTAYYEADGVSLKSNIDIPPHVQKLHKAFESFRELYKDEIETLKNKRDNKDASLDTTYSEREREVIYAGVNIREFMTVALTSPVFQKELSQVPSKTHANLWEEIKDIFMNIINEIYPGLKDNTMAKDAIVASMNFINEESKVRREKQEQEVLPADIETEMAKENSTKPKYGVPQSSEVKPSDEPNTDPSNNIRDENSGDLSITDTENIDTFAKEEKSACEGGLAI